MTKEQIARVSVAIQSRMDDAMINFRANPSIPNMRVLATECSKYAAISDFVPDGREVPKDVETYMIETTSRDLL